MDTPDIPVLKGTNGTVFLQPSSGMKTLKEKGKQCICKPHRESMCSHEDAGIGKSENKEL